jgi:hypothetical protein
MRRLILGLALVLAACGDDEEDGSQRGLDGGSIDAGVTPGDGGHDAEPDGGVVNTLCAKYGGAPGIERAIKQHVLEELASDCTVGLHFTMLPANRLARFGDCLTYQAQELFGCPGVRYAASKSPNGLPCRDMRAAHAGLGLSTGDFDAVMADVAGGLLKAGVSQDDIATVAPALLRLEAEIVESSTPAPSRSCDADASVDGGADASD